MAYGETQEVFICALSLDEEEAGYLLNLLANHTGREGLNANGGPLARIREALREAGVRELLAYSSLAKTGVATPYATSEEANAVIAAGREKACYKCGRTTGDIVDIKYLGSGQKMHAYGNCANDGRLY